MLWRSIDIFRTYPPGPGFVVEAIEQPLVRLHCQVRALRVNDNPFVHATSLAIEIVLHLSWPAQLELDITHLASELKAALCMIPIRVCFLMDLTSFQLMIGAIAAEAGSSTRTWFLSKLKRAVLVLRSRGWDEPLELFDKTFVPNKDIIRRLRSLWKELGGGDTSV